MLDKLFNAGSFILFQLTTGNQLRAPDCMEYVLLVAYPVVQLQHIELPHLSESENKKVHTCASQCFLNLHQTLF